MIFIDLLILRKKNPQLQNCLAFDTDNFSKYVLDLNFSWKFSLRGAL